MSLTSEAIKSAKEEGVIIHKVNTRRDSVGAYIVYINGSEWTDGFWDSADEAKADCIESYTAHWAGCNRTAVLGK
jgi:hypothetical protein